MQGAVQVLCFFIRWPIWVDDPFCFDSNDAFVCILNVSPIAVAEGPELLVQVAFRYVDVHTEITPVTTERD